jgi:hypothetical protein
MALPSIVMMAALKEGRLLIRMRMRMMITPWRSYWLSLPRLRTEGTRHRPENLRYLTGSPNLRLGNTARIVTGLLENMITDHLEGLLLLQFHEILTST